MSGFFMMRRKIINNVSLRPTGYKILLELLIEGHYSNIAEVPYIFHVRDSGKSKLGLKTQIDYLKHLLQRKVVKSSLLIYTNINNINFNQPALQSTLSCIISAPF